MECLLKHIHNRFPNNHNNKCRILNSKCSWCNKWCPKWCSNLRTHRTTSRQQWCSKCNKWWSWCRTWCSIINKWQVTNSKQLGSNKLSNSNNQRSQTLKTICFQIYSRMQLLLTLKCSKSQQVTILSMHLVTQAAAVDLVWTSKDLISTLEAAVTWWDRHNNLRNLIIPLTTCFDCWLYIHCLI
jgi:hypothetical protein